MTDKQTLLIVFVKNPRLGKVKTRLAQRIGEEAALTIYNALIKVTQKATNKLRADIHVCFSDFKEDQDWREANYFVQEGNDLGERMLNAFKTGFDLNYKKVILIGSDLPEISKDIIEEAFALLDNNSVVFGPAEDGGYYLVGLNKMNTMIFKNKSWSTPQLLNETLNELADHNIKVSLTKTLNDIDTFDDLKNYPELLKLI